jgi:ankyrin repeat protein
MTRLPTTPSRRSPRDDSLGSDRHPFRHSRLRPRSYLEGMKLDVGREDFSPFMAAAHGGDPETVRFLIERGADVRARTKSGYAAIYAAASWPGNAEVVGMLLDRGADPSVQMEITQPIEDVFRPSQGAGRR